jgi:hypothetical protein
MHLPGSNILIVGEAPGTLELRERLIAAGANVQVVSVAGAAIIIRQKQIDGAFIGVSTTVTEIGPDPRAKVSDGYDGPE